MRICIAYVHFVWCDLCGSTCVGAYSAFFTKEERNENGRKDVKRCTFSVLNLKLNL